MVKPCRGLQTDPSRAFVQWGHCPTRTATVRIYLDVRKLTRCEEPHKQPPPGRAPVCYCGGELSGVMFSQVGG